MPFKENKMSLVAIERINDYDVPLIKESLISMIGKTEFPEVNGKRILLKPNILSDAGKEKAITTHPAVLEAIISILQDKGAKEILVGDSPGLHTPGFNARNSGIKDVIDRMGAEFEDFTKNNREHTVYRSIKVPMALAIDNADVVISVAKFKTHQLMMMTGCVKNMFGLVPGLNKSPMHLKCPSVNEFAKLIISIFRESHTDYAIMDAVIGMEGAGPANGRPRKVGLLLSSSDAFALDYAEAVIMGYERKDMPIINEAISEGIFDPRKVEYPILNAKDLIIRDFERVKSQRRNLFSALILPFFTRFFKIRKDRARIAPEFQDNCIKCRRCIDICPAKALSMGEKHPIINEKACIRCYCCHEMCPIDAIKIF